MNDSHPAAALSEEMHSGRRLRQLNKRNAFPAAIQLLEGKSLALPGTFIPAQLMLHNTGSFAEGHVSPHHSAVGIM